jgi:import inner membrane translocase subunit TIM44
MRQRLYSKGTKGGDGSPDDLLRAAAKATAVLGDKVTQAQELAKDTMSELLKGSRFAASSKESDSGQAAAAAAGPSGDQQQQQQQQQQHEERDQKQEQQQEQTNRPPTLVQRLGSFASLALQEMRQAVLPAEPTASALSGAAPKAGNFQGATTTELTVTAARESGWQRQWRDTRERLSGHPLFKRLGAVTLKDNRVYEAGKELADGIRERWETSDSPLVHRIQVGVLGDFARAACSV